MMIPGNFCPGDFWPREEWAAVAAHRARWERWRDSIWGPLQGFGFFHGITPAMPLAGVKLVLSYFERGTASRNAWDWLGTTEADDDAVIAGIKEFGA